MTIFSTIWSDDVAYRSQVEVLDWRQLGDRGLFRALGRLRAQDVVIVNGAIGFPGKWRDLASLALRRANERPGVVVADATWEPRSDRAESSAPRLWPLNDRVNRTLLERVAGPRTVACFLSRAEVAWYLADTGRPAGAAAFTPFFASAEPPEGLQRAAHPYVFSGGDSLRDWELLRDALGGLEIPVRVATRHTRGVWPPNFEVGPVPHDEFIALARGATVGVLCLRHDVRRSVGQQTYLNLLRFGVPVVVNDAPGVTDHLADLPGAYVTPAGNADAIRRTVLGLIDQVDRESRPALAARAQAAVAACFSQPAYLGRLISIARSLEIHPAG
ncbi:hypothetical protein GHK86_04630 [Acidimicrobiaceae bacterium USS-CC1]|uniref:Glycosyltransferase n=1 Tax=Acidiferrimicrobium australe TaxID=2664430 RepID=A0ABW9QQT2_9ACTN|nr:hypothetical protein [Acidiferrimicrobium australe]